MTPSRALVGIAPMSRFRALVVSHYTACKLCEMIKKRSPVLAAPLFKGLLAPFDSAPVGHGNLLSSVGSHLTPCDSYERSRTTNINTKRITDREMKNRLL